MIEERIPRSQKTIPAANRIGGAILALYLALSLAVCAPRLAQTPEEIGEASVIVKTAVGDAEEAARRARAFNSVNIWNRAANEVEEAEVILRKALDARERIRRVHRAAVAVLAALQAKAGEVRGSSVADAANHVDDVGSVLAVADRHVAAIEQTVTTLQKLDIPSRR